MRFGQIGLLTSALLVISALPASATPKLRRGPTAPRVVKERPSPAPASKPKAAGIDSQRATQIQSALIKAGYMSGSPSGVWDASTQAAMEKVQSDNGWPTRFVPDARALIKLGLGPNSSATTLATTPNSEPDSGTAAEGAPASTK